MPNFKKSKSNGLQGLIGGDMPGISFFTVFWFKEHEYVYLKIFNQTSTWKSYPHPYHQLRLE